MCPLLVVKQQLHTTLIVELLLSAVFFKSIFWYLRLLGRSDTHHNKLISEPSHPFVSKQHTLYLSSQLCWIAQIGDTRLNAPFFHVFFPYSIFACLCIYLPARLWKPGYFKHHLWMLWWGRKREKRPFLSLCLRDKYKQTQLGQTGQVTSSVHLPPQASLN